MRYTQHHLRSAPIAIAAMLALGTSSGMAQTAQPPASSEAAEPIVLQLPVDAPADEPAPTPEATTVSTSPTPEPTTVSEPVVQPVPPATIALDLPAAEAEAEEPAAAATPSATAAEPAETAPAREPATPVAETRSVAAADATNDSPAVAPSETEEAPVAAPLPVSEPAPVAAADTAAPEPIAEPDWLAFIALALAGLIPITLAFLAFAWFRRRSHRVSRHETAALENQAEDDPAATPMVESDPVAPVAEPEPPVEREPAPARTSPLDSYRGLPNSGAAVALPTAVPETFEERDALLKRMIAAEPDRANPFRSTRARAKRARLILQSLGRKFENVKPRIDLSEYTANWPALARRRTAYA